jgi:hypothetical protein
MAEEFPVAAINNTVWYLEHLCMFISKGKNSNSDAVVPASNCTPVMYHSFAVLSARLTWPTALSALSNDCQEVAKVPEV